MLLLGTRAQSNRDVKLHKAPSKSSSNRVCMLLEQSALMVTLDQNSSKHPALLSSVINRVVFELFMEALSSKTLLLLMLMLLLPLLLPPLLAKQLLQWPRWRMCCRSSSLTNRQSALLATILTKLRVWLQ